MSNPALPGLFLAGFMTATLIFSGLAFFLRKKIKAERQFDSGLRRLARSLQKEIQEHKTERTKLLTILDNLAEGVLAVDRDRSILISNPSAQHMLGFKNAKLKGKSLIQVIQNAEVDEMMEQAIRSQRAFSKEVEFTSLAEKIVKADAIGISQAEGEICGLLVLFDITELRKLENLRRDFVANVSHELRTPLTSIRGFIETLASGALKDTAKSASFLKMMEEDALRLNRLVDDLLELSKIESKTSLPHLESFDLAKEVEKIISSFAPLLKSKNLSTQNLLRQKNLPPLRADREKIRQVLVNLIENAAKFTPASGSIAVDAWMKDKNFCVSVQDTGCGIPQDAIPRIFERFFRVDKARSRELGGTGLGLSIVKHLVESHGGQISCQSKLGKGSTFLVSLPQ